MPINLLPDVLKVELAVKSAYEGREGDEKLRKRWVHVHKELPPYVLRRKAAKVDLVEPKLSASSYDTAVGASLHDRSRMMDPPQPHNGRDQADDAKDIPLPLPQPAAPAHSPPPA
jgi:hypothetical protein